MYHAYVLPSPSNLSCFAYVSSALHMMAPKDRQDPDNVIRVHIIDFEEVLAKMELMGRFLFWAGLSNSSQISIKSFHS